MVNSTQICQACKEEKPLSDFYFRKETGKYRIACKSCKSVNTKEDILARVNAKTKICKHCNIEKPTTEYQKAGRGKWTQPYCKDCDKLRKKKWGINNEGRLKIKRQKYYKEVVRAKYIPHPKILKTKEEIKERNKRYRNLPYVKAKKAQQDRMYREKNKDKVKAKKKEYYNLYGNEQAKKWQKKMMNDIGFRVKKNLRGRIYVALKRGVKSEGTMKLLGCTIEQFKTYFESLFTEGMSWDKYLEGGIHIDHKIPCKKFDLTKPSEQKKCFHYTNLQPLWKLDNLRKGISLNYKPKTS